MLTVGIFSHPGRLGSGKTQELVRLSHKLVSLKGILMVRKKELWGYFKMTTSPLSLPETEGDFSAVFTLRTWWGSWR